MSFITLRYICAWGSAKLARDFLPSPWDDMMIFASSFHIRRN